MKNRIYIFYKYSLLIIFLQSMFAWFTWGHTIPIIFLTVIATITIAYTSRGIYSFTKKNIISIILLSLIQLYVVRDQNLNAFISALLRITIISFVLTLKDQIKIDLFQFLTKAITSLLLVSIVAYLMFLVGVSLPYSKTEFTNYTFDNYYFFLDNKEMIFPRFSSIFLEPGQLGMIISFLLYANQFDIKRKEVWVLLFANILTFSLAAYILSIFSFVAFLYLKERKPIYILMVAILFLILAYSFFKNLNNGDNLVNNLIIERLTIVDRSIAGNNRVNNDIDVLLNNVKKENSTIYFGLGANGFSNLNIYKGAGYKIYILTYGLIGTLITFLLYLSITLDKKSRLGILFLIVYCLNFLQAAYPLWECELIIFILALPLLKLDKTNMFRLPATKKHVKI